MQLDTTWKGWTVHFLDWWIKPQCGHWHYRFTFEVKRGRFAIYWKSPLYNRLFTLSARHVNLLGLVVSWR